jgi:hypothetical protein
VRSTRPKDFRSIPSATGGIARLACARLRELGKDVKAILSKAGLRLEEADDPTARLEVRTQIKILELAAEELRDDLLGFHLARSFDLREIGLVYYVIASSEQLRMLFVRPNAIAELSMTGSACASNWMERRSSLSIT